MVEPKRVRFTVVTPTYNRASTLPRLYASLASQTLKDFEWVIVDDGSTDETEIMVAEWVNEACFPVRYFKQSHGGKHRAFNSGVSEARGDFIAPTDSDAWLFTSALERLAAIWETIAIDKRPCYCGVAVLSSYGDGRIVGSSFGKGIYDASYTDMMLNRRMTGDRWGFMLTDLLRNFPYPEVVGEDFIPDGLVWLRISGSYLMRIVNEPLQFVEYRADGLSNNLVAVRALNPQGVCLYYREILSHRLPFRYRFRNLANLARFSLHGGTSKLSLRLEHREFASLFAVFTGYFIYWYDIYRLRRAGKACK
ncbi:MAG: glycosyltransferase family 2 protein [Geobacter sp.]|nr:glycosyltransferase family 2 protein [Geobacter sp.]